MTTLVDMTFPNFHHTDDRLPSPGKTSSTNALEVIQSDVIRSYAHTKRVGSYLLGKTIGEGSFAKVKEGVHVLTGEKVAIKVIDKKKAKEDAYVRRNMRREGRLLQQVRHRNIIQLFEILETENSYYLVTEFCGGGDLMTRICTRKRLDEAETRKYIRQVVSAVDYLHKAGILHRDLKVENLLLDERKDIKIIDFGLSNSFRSAESKDGSGVSVELCVTQCGSPAYAAPELLSNSKYGPEVDIWSIGVNMFAMLTGSLPFTVDPFTIKALHCKMVNGDMNPLPEQLSTNCKELLKRFLTADPTDRITLPEAMLHPWLTDGRSRAIKAAPFPNRLSVVDLDPIVLKHMATHLDFNLSDVLRQVSLNLPSTSTATYQLLVRRLARGCYGETPARGRAIPPSETSQGMGKTQQRGNGTHHKREFLPAQEEVVKTFPNGYTSNKPPEQEEEEEEVKEKEHGTKTGPGRDPLDPDFTDVSITLPSVSSPLHKKTTTTPSGKRDFHPSDQGTNLKTSSSEKMKVFASRKDTSASPSKPLGVSVGRRPFNVDTAKKTENDDQLDDEERAQINTEDGEGHGDAFNENGFVNNKFAQATEKTFGSNDGDAFVVNNDNSDNNNNNNNEDEKGRTTKNIQRLVGAGVGCGRDSLRHLAKDAPNWNSSENKENRIKPPKALHAEKCIERSTRYEDVRLYKLNLRALPQQPGKGLMEASGKGPREAFTGQSPRGKTPIAISREPPSVSDDLSLTSDLPLIAGSASQKAENTLTSTLTPNTWKKPAARKTNHGGGVYVSRAVTSGSRSTPFGCGRHTSRTQGGATNVFQAPLITPEMTSLPVQTTADGYGRSAGGVNRRGVFFTPRPSQWRVEQGFRPGRSLTERRAIICEKGESGSLGKRERTRGEGKDPGNDPLNLQMGSEEFL